MMSDKAIIILDVDEVLNSFGQQLADVIRPGITSAEIESLKNWDIFLLFNEEEMKQVHKLLSEVDFWANLLPRETSQKTVDQLRSEGHEIIFCTAPWPYCFGWETTRRDWLKKHYNADGREDLIITSRKDLVYGDMFVDDKPESVTKWQNRWCTYDTFNCHGFLYETPSNSFSDVWPRVRVINEQWELVKK
ncbi:MAG: hypothetical protein UT24_C0050G0007 [Candidatus Woesebacteria bacterium GW2011_GWB1_39_12]|uniref:Uncharacterized protein n=1 Tax=Candidatus Woesebacteria bacterium GW2011_GWB1_39_12 TaxID=1618574 RepID=A0A0G0M1T2_9BACT|nr:MAG: hypothetical protein UT24_C0050G0007 [Candidatus Woesebacteria bacterium GW2011_GWB1_39_12]